MNALFMLRIPSKIRNNFIMRINLDIDETLLKEALRLSKANSKKELINEALREFVLSRKRLDLRELKGKISFRKDYNYKELRERRV